MNLGIFFRHAQVAEYRKLFPTYEQPVYRKRGRWSENRIRDVRTRAWDFLKEMEAKHKGKNILIVSHEDTIWMLSQIALGWSEKVSIEKEDGITAICS